MEECGTTWPSRSSTGQWHSVWWMRIRRHNPPREMPDDEDVSFDERKCDDRIRLKEIPGNEEILSNEPVSASRIPQHEMPDDDKILFEQQEGVERIPPKYHVPCSEFCLFEETGGILLFNNRDHKWPFLSVSWVIRCNPQTVSFPPLQDETQTEWTSFKHGS